MIFKTSIFHLSNTVHFFFFWDVSLGPGSLKKRTALCRNRSELDTESRLMVLDVLLADVVDRDT